jgi:hypothetical protein
MQLAISFPLIDTERMTPTNGGGGLSVRAWLAVGLVLLAVVWQFVRLVVLR